MAVRIATGRELAFGLILLLLCNCSVTVTAPVAGPASEISDSEFDVTMRAAPPPSGLVGKTITYEIETTGKFGSVAETAQIRISKSGEVYLFARVGAQRGTVYKINNEIDVVKKLGLCRSDGAAKHGRFRLASKGDICCFSAYINKLH